MKSSIAQSRGDYEGVRIRQLQEERISTQKKAFTKWINASLGHVGLSINDLFVDLTDGKVLTKLLEALTGQKIGCPHKGKLRLHRIENIHRCLAFLSSKVNTGSIGAEDIADGNSSLILGLIWTIILHFQIQKVAASKVELRTVVQKSATDALLLWCQNKTAGYNNVFIQDFTNSWRNGLAFSAIIHSHRPDLIDLSKLSSDNALKNLNYAFNVAYSRLGIAKVLDADDLDWNVIDEKSITVYVSMLYQHFSKAKKEQKESQRIAKFLDSVMTTDETARLFFTGSSILALWLADELNQLHHLQKKELSGSTAEITAQLAECARKRLHEWPARWQEKVNLDILRINIQTRWRMCCGRELPTMLSSNDMYNLHESWNRLQEAMNCKEKNLKHQLYMQKKLDCWTARWTFKAQQLDDWLQKVSTWVTAVTTSSGLEEKTMKRLTAVMADLSSKFKRYSHITGIVDRLIKEDYAEKDLLMQRHALLGTRLLEAQNSLETLKEAHVSKLQHLKLTKAADEISADLSVIETALTFDNKCHNPLDEELRLWNVKCHSWNCK